MSYVNRINFENSFVFKEHVLSQHTVANEQIRKIHKKLFVQSKSDILH